MKTVRLTAAILFYLSRIASILVLTTTAYALAVVLLHHYLPSASLPIEVDEQQGFRIFLPFTHTAFLLGDYTISYLVPNILTILFYGLFLWLLGGVFHAFRQPKMFTRKGVSQLSRFYLVNLIVPFIFIGLILVFGQELIDMVRIILLHLVIGVFAFFMAAIFRQGVILQEEQDLTF
jgi:hypothetical protein